MDWIVKILKELVARKFTGNIQINFQFGGISNVNILESIKPPKDEESNNYKQHKKMQ